MRQVSDSARYWPHLLYWLHSVILCPLLLPPQWCPRGCTISCIKKRAVVPVNSFIDFVRPLLTANYLKDQMNIYPTPRVYRWSSGAAEVNASGRECGGIPGTLICAALIQNATKIAHTNLVHFLSSQLLFCTVYQLLSCSKVQSTMRWQSIVASFCAHKLDISIWLQLLSLLLMCTVPLHRARRHNGTIIQTTIWLHFAVCGTVAHWQLCKTFTVTSNASWVA